MSQFLMMLSGTMGQVADVGAEMRVQWFKYLITRFEPTDIPQIQIVGFMQSMSAKQMLRNQVVKSTAISDSSIKKQTFHEVERGEFVRAPTTERWKVSMPRTRNSLSLSTVYGGESEKLVSRFLVFSEIDQQLIQVESSRRTWSSSEDHLSAGRVCQGILHGTGAWRHMPGNGRLSGV
ncbi:hypothetical protein ACSV5K_25130 [Agrobacterium pusense]|uniref:hypothetical protein n=1 Tax=Agrobacterium pusense TaxID=648995 RepID=UPI003FD1E87A